MKIRSALLLACSAVLGLSVSVGAGVVASAADTVSSFTATQGQVTTNTSSKTGITTTKGAAGTVMSFAYSTSVDFTNGAYFQYVIPKATDIDIDEEARGHKVTADNDDGYTVESGNNYILVTVKDDSGYGVEFKIYALYSKTATTHLNKMEVDVTYLDPTITAASGNDYSVGRQYLETFTTYQNVEDTKHTIDLHKEDGMWFFAADGYSALPVTAINNSLVLDNCSITVDVYSKTADPQIKLYPVAEGIAKSYVIDGFMQLGSDEVSYNNDDTVKIKVADKRAAEYPGQLIRYREQLISTVGYDVRQPINIEYSYDVSNASAVWYALGLGRPDVLETIDKQKYNVNGNNIVSTSTYSDSLAAKNDGIMLQTTTGLAQPTYQPQNGRKESYKTNSKSKPYSSRDDMDIITFIVKENGTDMYMNGTLIFSDLVTKLSDFASNNYIAYPYFHFFEDNASTAKGNTIVIKGVNAARRTDDKDLKVVGGSNVDLTVGLTDNDNGAITLWNYVDGTLTAVDASLYSYDTVNKQLTLKYDYFADKEYAVYKLYARNNSGSEEIEVRLSDPGLSTIPASTDKEVYEWYKDAEELQDLVVRIDIHNGTFVSFSGSGIMSSQYTYTPDANSTEGTITIKKSYLKGKKVGSYTYTIKTTNSEEDIFTYTFTIKVKTADSDDEDSETSTSSSASASASSSSSTVTDTSSNVSETPVTSDTTASTSETTNTPASDTTASASETTVASDTTTTSEVASSSATNADSVVSGEAGRKGCNSVAGLGSLAALGAIAVLFLKKRSDD